MTVFDVLTLIGGLSLFLFGMSVMGSALERRAGKSLRSVLGKLTGNRLMGLLTGIAVTAAIQSSGATTVMVVGFVNSGLMTLNQSVSVIMGANIGTTVTAWILSLSGISGENFFLQLLKPASFTPILALVGILFFLGGKSTKRKDTGMILLGFATLMFGMNTMSGAVEGLRDVSAFTGFFTLLENPLLGVLVGAIFTAILQSSSASVGILQAVAVTGQVSYGAAIPIIMGQNIGACATTLLAAIGANKNAKRAAYLRLIFNLIGTFILLAVFILLKIFLTPVLFSDPASILGIAVCHTVYNLVCTLMLLPFANLLERLAIRCIPDSSSPEDKEELDERLLATPSVALEQCHLLTAKMAKCAVKALRGALASLSEYKPETCALVRKGEEMTDHYEDILSTYLVKLGNRP